MILYQFVRVIVISVCKVVFRVRVRGKDKIPRSGAFILAPSHRSLLDIPFGSFVTRRRTYFLAKKELFERAWLAKIFLALGCIPVDRGEPDRKALRACAAALEAGHPIMVFPEGTRNHGPEIMALFDGTAWLAAKVGVPIVPIGIAGSEEILSKGKVIPKLRRVAVVVGDPIPPPSRDGGRTKRAEIAATTAVLHEQLQAVFTDALAMITR